MKRNTITYQKNVDKVYVGERYAFVLARVCKTDKIALARHHTGSRWVRTSTDQIKKPTSRSILKCKEGEWPRTREFQLIWWLNVYLQAGFGYLQLRFFIEHVEVIN